MFDAPEPGPRWAVGDGGRRESHVRRAISAEIVALYTSVYGHDRTTAEVIGKWLYDWCKARWPEVIAVRVEETPKTWAEYRP